MKTPNRNHLVLLGAGHAHLEVIKKWPQHGPSFAYVTLISPTPIQTYSGMMPGWVAGAYELGECQVDIRPWLKRANIRWIQDSCVGINATLRQLYLRGAPEAPFSFDQLSIDIGSSMSPAQIEHTMPGASGRVLPIRPMDIFATHWNAAVGIALERRMDICIIGAGPAGVELAFACKAKMRKIKARASVTLLTGGVGQLLPQYSEQVQSLALKALKQAEISVLPHRGIAFEDGCVVLDNQLKLKCDLPIIATGSMAPEWLKKTDLALDKRGYIQVNSYQQSTSHTGVFACGDIASRNDISHPKSGVYAIRSGEQMAEQLASSLRRGQLKEVAVQPRSLNILNTSNGRAIASYGDWSTSGWLAWLLKDYIDRRYIKSFQTLPTRTQK
jgi:NADH dehydrogenase FAD-containing subunit